MALNWTTTRIGGSQIIHWKKDTNRLFAKPAGLLSLLTNVPNRLYEGALDSKIHILGRNEVAVIETRNDDFSLETIFETAQLPA